ncbi:MAG: DUF1080 domain-containing protein [Prolixibacteraceae bacterium]|jgi:hypothetical protein|nr:DUF1080 domain-containing protein [Prolixibacteraceae bacterium]
MKPNKIVSVTTIFLILFSLNACQPKKVQKKGWIQLFNGKDLSGWEMKFAGHPLNENYKNTFRVEDGLLKIRYDEYESFDNKFGHLFYHKNYSHYKLRVEYRFVGEQCPGGPGWAFRNNGVMIHGQKASTMELDQDFPTSVEVQLLGGNGTDERPTLNLCTPGTNVVMDGELRLEHCINSQSKTFHGDQWVTAELEVYGDSLIRHIVNGEIVMEYTHPQLDERDASYQKLLPPDGNKLLKGGSISIQAESHPTDFRKIELLNLGDDCEE